MKLSQLLATELPHDPEISGLSSDSRLVQPGDVFFALSGYQVQGHGFIHDAIQKGAVAIVTERADQPILDAKIPQIYLPNLKNTLGKIAARFYDFPANELRIVGVTGTSGKTSCSQFIAAALHQLKQVCGVIGTLGNGLYGDLQPSAFTTPDAVSLQKTLKTFVQASAEFVSMEVSSHALDQGRVAGLEFEVGLFTNLSRDHLDYHGTMAAYGQTKAQLFQQSRHKILNAEDAFCAELLRSNSLGENVFAIAIDAHPKDYPSDIEWITVRHIQTTKAGISADIQTPWGESHISLKLSGIFNLMNGLMTLTTLCVLGYSLRDAVMCLEHLQPVAGRMEKFTQENQPTVIVDYAHKPDALEKVLKALRAECAGKLWCVFGCGGERDKGKRPLMAEIAEQFSDRVIVTNDNPRSENADDIVKDILSGFSDISKVVVQQDRARAIQEAVQSAAANDTILIAGKGAETYQIIGQQELPFSDIEHVKNALLKGGSNASLVR
ncbi:MAG: UDP-N-acetylmuramoyl-L-alanyl-D-glutamate--2,6-diaminopimelate ligase [Gammaproteobacteria bacterium]|nr:UDP-N-acetylmuramoyl-L-alanyl-D-glutamate--2,6-diaminopimelate ligase [Gammaproteobacteria bacterium]